MSFRLRIFMLVMVVALTAIVATAWLTLSLAARALEQSQRVEARDQTEIVEAVQRYGLLHGRVPSGWAGQFAYPWRRPARRAR